VTALVVYDSAYGNTEKIAAAIGAAIPGSEVRRIGAVDPAALPVLGRLIVGSPTQGGQPTKATQAWLAAIPKDRLAGVEVAAFDTRMAASDQGLALRFIMGVIGYAASRILTALEARGGSSIASAEGFVVNGKEGPLHEGELDRAGAWARALDVRTKQAA
jgi:flavodoxin I